MKLPPRILMMVTEPNPKLADIVDAAVSGGVNVVQLRDKSGRNLRDDARAIRERIGSRALLVVNGQKIDGADGVHLPEHAPSLAVAGKLLGRSVHSVEKAMWAESEGADYVVIGTIFPSKSHRHIPAAGVALIENVAAQVAVPLIAIGGVTPKNAQRCIEAGASGVAVLSPLMSARDPRAIAAEYWSAIS